MTDAQWIERIRETAAGLRDNSLALAKYPHMGQEARARELAAIYIGEIADMYEVGMKVAAVACITSIEEEGDTMTIRTKLSELRGLLSPDQVAPRDDVGVKGEGNG